MLKIHQCDVEGGPEFVSHPQMRNVNVWKHKGTGDTTHDCSCYICHERPAIFVISEDFFQPCGTCQREGWTLSKPKPRKQSFFGRLFGFDYIP